MEYIIIVMIKVNKKKTKVIYNLLASEGQKSGRDLAQGFWLRKAHKVAATVLFRAAIISELDWGQRIHF